MAETGHRCGGEHIQNHLLRGAGLHPSGARDDLRPNLRDNCHVRGLAKRGFRVADDGHSLGAVPARIFEGRDGEGSASAGGNAHHDIPFGGILPRDFFAAELAGVFIGFDGCRQRFWAAGDDELDRMRIDVKSGRTLDGVEVRDSSARAGAHVNEAPALGECGSNQVDRPRDLRERAFNGGRDLGILAIDDARNVERRLAIEIGRGGVCFLSGEPAEFGCRSVADPCFAFRSFEFHAIFPKASITAS